MLKTFSHPNRSVFLAYTAVIFAVGQTLLARNVLRFTIDSCRSDRFGVYGYSQDNTPHIDAWAKTETVFRNAYSTSAWTAPGRGPYSSGAEPSPLNMLCSMTLGPATIISPGSSLSREITSSWGP